MSTSSEDRRIVGWILGGLLLLGALGYLVGGWEGVLAIVSVLGFIAPVLPVAMLVPWYFIARHQGLMPRKRPTDAVTIDDDGVRVGRKQVAWNSVARARIVRNDNWTESLLLDDAMTLFDARGRELVRISLAAERVADVEKRLGVPVETRWVSAPAYLD